MLKLLKQPKNKNPFDNNEIISVKLFKYICEKFRKTLSYPSFNNFFRIFCRNLGTGSYDCKPWLYIIKHLYKKYVKTTKAT